MINMLPDYEQKSEYIRGLYESAEKAVALADNYIYDAADELYVLTATSAGIQRHQGDVGLADIVADLETKRGRVLTRLRGSGPLTPAKLKPLVELYEPTGVIITEYPSQNHVKIGFPNYTGIPYHIDRIMQSVNESVPAHISVDYQYNNNTWQSAREKLHTWRTDMTWNAAALYDGHIWIDFRDDGIYMIDNMDNADAYVIYKDGLPYAHRMEVNYESHI